MKDFWNPEMRSLHLLLAMNPNFYDDLLKDAI
jgi:hypothetical protein